MKKTVFFIAFIIIIAGLSLGCAKQEQVKILAIRDIQTDPLSFTGEIIVNGIVAVIAHDDDTIFGIMDTAELLSCKNLSCGAFILPVKYVGGGTVPELADEINVTGSWIESEAGFIFEVAEVEIKRNVMSILMGG